MPEQMETSTIYYGDCVEVMEPTAPLRTLAQGPHRASKKRCGPPPERRAKSPKAQAVPGLSRAES